MLLMGELPITQNCVAIHTSVGSETHQLVAEKLYLVFLRYILHPVTKKLILMLRERLHNNDVLINTGISEISHYLQRQNYDFYSIRHISSN